MKAEVEIKGMLPQPKNVWSHQKLKDAQKDSPLETSKGAWPC